MHEICGIPVETITDDASVDHELQMESIQLVDLQVAIEHELDVTVDLIAVLDLNSFGRIVDYLHALASGKTAL